MNLLLHTDVVLSACLGDVRTRTVLQNARLAGMRHWVYAGHFQAIYDQLCVTLKHDPDQAKRTLQHFSEEIQWLAALADDIPAALEPGDTANNQLQHARTRLGADTAILTNKPDLFSNASPTQTIDSLTQSLKENSGERTIPFIDLARQQDQIRGKLEAGLHKVMHHGRYIMGPEVPELETRLAEYVGTKHAVGVSSGTDSLLIAMMALGIGQGDEVITVPYTWISTAEMIQLLGAKPVFVDIDPHTWNMDPAKLERAITERSKAIMPVGIYGQTADMDPINDIAQRRGNLPVIEDAAQCFGSAYKGKRSCALSTIGSTSFFPSKPLGGYGEGGALFTDDDDMAERMRQIRVHGQEKKHHHPILGLNGRLDSMQAAVILAKLDVFDQEIEKRQHIAEYYSHALSPLSGITLPHVGENHTSVWAQYTILSNDRDAIAERLKSKRIPSVSYYAVPLHLQPVFQHLEHQKGDFPVTEKVASQGLSLPMSPGLTETELQSITAAIQADSVVTRSE